MRRKYDVRTLDFARDNVVDIHFTLWFCHSDAAYGIPKGSAISQMASALTALCLVQYCCFRKATLGTDELAGAMYYNDSRQT